MEGRGGNGQTDTIKKSDEGQMRAISVHSIDPSVTKTTRNNILYRKRFWSVGCEAVVIDMFAINVNWTQNRRKARGTSLCLRIWNNI